MQLSLRSLYCSGTLAGTVLKANMNYMLLQVEQNCLQCDSGAANAGLAYHISAAGIISRKFMPPFLFLQPQASNCCTMTIRPLRWLRTAASKRCWPAPAPDSGGRSEKSQAQLKFLPKNLNLLLSTLSQVPSEPKAALC